MHRYLVDMLQCPACNGVLIWDISDHRGDQIEEADARCVACGATYPVREGIAVFLTPDLPREDLWEQVDNRLSEYMREHPDTERQLLEVPLDVPC